MRLVLLIATLINFLNLSAQVKDSIAIFQRMADSLAAEEAELLMHDRSSSLHPDVAKIEEAEDYFRESKYEEAKYLFYTLANYYDLPYFWFMLSMCYFENKEYLDAIEYSTKCIERFEKEPVVNADNKIEYKKADMNEYFEEVVIGEHNFNVGSITPSGLVFHRFAGLLYKKNISYIVRGISKNESNDYYGAIEDLRKFHMFSKDSTVLTNEILGFALLKIGKPKEAKKYFDKAIEIANKTNDRANLADIYYSRGNCYFKLNQPEKACLDWSRAGELGRKDSYVKIREHCSKN